MNRKVGAALLVLGAVAPSLLSAQAPPDSAEREVLALHRQINEAMFRGDPGPLADSVVYSEREVRVRGNTAVVEREVREALLAEQRVFLAGDRETVQTSYPPTPSPSSWTAA